ncbi:WD repeat-containing protein wat1 [Orobanche hederae]
MLALQFGYAGFHVVSRLALNMGISKIVFPVYRKKERPPFTWSFILEFFLLAIVGITSNQGLYLVGMDNTSPTFAFAIQNSVPTITFLMAALLRIEKVRLNRKAGISKVAGLIICVAALHELLNNFGSYLSNHHDAVYENGSIVGRDASVNGFPLESNQETVRPMDMEGSEGHTPSPSGRTGPTDGGVL